MELAVLAAWIDSRREVVQQVGVELPTRERRHAVAAVALDLPQRERAVLAPAPRDEYGFCPCRYVQRAALPVVCPRLKPRHNSATPTPPLSLRAIRPGRCRDGAARRAAPRHPRRAARGG